ncbi:hypothetical protein, partial [Saccharopolyspora gregorii]|uniref:hypothetical protein n=1 Tax=Saccharopolyspora gregorii TaxID=33914 RepID=UPI0031E8EFA1
MRTFASGSSTSTRARNSSSVPSASIAAFAARNRARVGVAQVEPQHAQLRRIAEDRPPISSSRFPVCSGQRAESATDSERTAHHADRYTSRSTSSGTARRPR